jgi:hypothetical protein
MLSGFPVYLANKELQQVIVRGLGNKVREFLNSLVVSQLLRLPVFCGSQRPFRKPNYMPLNFWAPATVNFHLWDLGWGWFHCHPGINYSPTVFS